MYIVSVQAVNVDDPSKPNCNSIFCTWGPITLKLRPVGKIFSIVDSLYFTLPDKTSTNVVGLIIFEF